MGTMSAPDAVVYPGGASVMARIQDGDEGALTKKQIATINAIRNMAAETVMEQEKERAARLRAGRKGSGGYKNISLLYVNKLIERAGDGLSVYASLKFMTAARVEIYQWMKSYEDRERYPGDGFSTFWNHWKKLRLGIPLQTRLLVEQVASDRGKPWSRIVTGFGVMQLVKRKPG